VAYCPPELLDDVADVLAEVRAWAGVVEKKHNVFYLRRLPFLHFHLLSDGRRRADLRSSDGWVQVDIPRPISGARRRALLRAARAIHRQRAPDASAPRATRGRAPR
jgi:hypothetical protein